MSELVITLTGDEAKLFQAQAKIIKQQVELEKGYAGVGESASKASREAEAAQKKAAAEAEKLEKLFKDQKNSLELVALAQKEGNAAATEMRAIQQGLTADQAKQLAEIQRRIDLEKAEREALREAAAEQKRAQKEIAAEAKRTAVEKEKAAAEERRNAEKQRRASEAAAAAEARLIAANKKAAEDAVAARQKDNADWLKGIVSAGAAYVSINAAVGAYKASLEEVVAIQKESLEAATQIAKAQSGTVQNLTGLSSIEKARALKNAGSISAEVGVERQYVDQALGAGYSAVGDLAATENALKAAAKITALTPEQLPTVTTGALDVRKGTGLDDAEKNLSFLLQAGKQARIEDPAKLSATLAKALASGVNTVQGQDKQTASREIAAVFTELTQFATDKTGDSTATAVITLTNKLDEFFREQQTTLDKLDEQIAPLRAKSEKGLTPEEEKKLTGLQNQRAGIASLNDDGTFFGRLEALQKNTEARGKFLENPVGEVAYQGAIRDLVSGGELSKRVEKNKGELGFDPKTFQTTVAELETLSPELRVARERTRAKATADAELVSADKPALGLIREVTEAALKANRRTQLGGALDSMYVGMQNTFAGDKTNVRDATMYAVSNLEAQKERLSIMKGQPEYQTKIDNLDKAIERVLSIGLNTSLSPTTAGASGAMKLDEQTAEMKKQTALLEKLAGSPTGAGNPAPSAAAIQAQSQMGVSQGVRTQ